MSALDKIINKAYDTPEPEERDEVEVAEKELIALRSEIERLKAENAELRKPVVIWGEKLRQPPEEK